MIAIYDKQTPKNGFNNNGLAVLDECVSAVVTENLNGEYSLELTYPANSRKAQHLEEFNIIKANGQLFRIYKAERTHGSGLFAKVWARHIFYDLAYFFIESAKIVNANCKEALEMTLPPETQAMFAFAAPQDNIYPFAVKEVNGVDVLFRLLGVYGGEIVRDNYSVAIIGKIGADSGVTIRYGKNIKGLTLTLDTTELATRIYPVGKDGILLPERYIDVDGGQMLSFDIIKRVEFNNADDEISLRTAAVKYAETSALPKINVSVDFLELSKVRGYENFSALTSVNIGDRVAVIHERLGLSAVLRVITVQTDLLNPMNNKITLGDPLKTIIEKLDTDSLLEEMKRLLDANKSGVIIKKNADVLTITTTRFAALAFGFVTKAPTNLTATVTLTGAASEDTTLNMRFSLDGVEYDLKPSQVVAMGDNVLGFTLPMPQVQAGSHAFVVDMWTNGGTFVIEKGNLQVTIEGLSLEGGLSATIPHIECFFAFYYSAFLLKLSPFSRHTSVTLANPPDTKKTIVQSLTYADFLSQKGEIVGGAFSGLLAVTKEVTGIAEYFSADRSSDYDYDADWIVWDSDTDKVGSTTYDSYACAKIAEPLLTSEGGLVETITDEDEVVTGVIYSVPLPNRRSTMSLFC
ncbi:hypothetical protein FACS1894132_11540 [Clostridia bacterium]|nr:hypothetical protein FACS1894132_11540 [Clostridia bacterium]